MYPSDMKVVNNLYISAQKKNAGFFVKRATSFARRCTNLALENVKVALGLPKARGTSTMHLAREP